MNPNSLVCVVCVDKHNLFDFNLHTVENNNLHNGTNSFILEMNKNRLVLIENKYVYRVIETCIFLKTYMMKHTKTFPQNTKNYSA